MPTQPDHQKLIDLVPTDGSTIGNAAVRNQPGWSEDRYSTAKDALVAIGALLKGQGRGGRCGALQQRRNIA